MRRTVIFNKKLVPNGCTGRHKDVRSVFGKWWRILLIHPTFCSPTHVWRSLTSVENKGRKKMTRWVFQSKSKLNLSVDNCREVTSSLLVFSPQGRVCGRVCVCVVVCVCVCVRVHVCVCLLMPLCWQLNGFWLLADWSQLIEWHQMPAPL